MHIEGFSDKNIRKCCSQYLGSKQEALKLMVQASKNARVYELLKTPIMLLMTSVLYNEDETKSLPERRTKLYEDLYEFIMDRSTLKPNNFGCYSSEVPNIQDMLQTLGRFAWEALQNDVRQLLINKVGIHSIFFLIFDSNKLFYLNSIEYLKVLSKHEFNLIYTVHMTS